MTTPAEEDLNAFSNETFLDDVQYLDASTGAPIDLSGRKVRLLVYRSPTDLTPILLASSDGVAGTTANTSITVTAATGRFTTRIEVATLALFTPSAQPLGRFKYYLVEPDGVTQTPLQIGRFYYR